MTSTAYLDDLYAAFAPNRPQRPMTYCAHCVSADEVRVLERTPLRELTAADLARYTRKAMSTWGEEPDFRHFLPRILELFATGEPSDGHQFVGTLRSVRFRQATWTAAESEAVDRYLDALWRRILTEREPPVPAAALLEGAAENEHTVVPFLRVWPEQTGEPAMVQLAMFVDAMTMSSRSDGTLRRESDAWIGTGVPRRMLEAALAATTDTDAAGWYGQALEMLDG